MNGADCADYKMELRALMADWFPEDVLADVLDSENPVLVAFRHIRGDPEYSARFATLAALPPMRGATRKAVLRRERPRMSMLPAAGLCAPGLCAALAAFVKLMNGQCFLGQPRGNDFTLVVN